MRINGRRASGTPITLTRWRYATNAHDANFNHTAVFDTSKNVIERYWYYTAYGDPGVPDANYAADSDEVSDIANATTYTGRSLDSETGLYHYRSLLRPPRFIERDKPVRVCCARRPPWPCAMGARDGG